MTHWILLNGIIVGSLALVLAAALVLGARAWDRATAGAVRRLSGSVARARSRGAVGPAHFAPEQLNGLPAPVIRYFTFALTPGQPLVSRARLWQAGTFARSPNVWAPFTAVEHFVVSPPGFVWDARIRMAPLVVARVRDSYVAGEGIMHGTLAGLLPIVDQRGTPEMAAGALLRYVAEAAWLPTALLPSAGVRWDAVDDHCARATLTDGATTVSMDVHFGISGEIVRILAQRYRPVEGKAVLSLWDGRFREYARVGGMMVPLYGEVGWRLAEGWFPYYRGRTVKAEFAFRGAERGIPTAAAPAAGRRVQRRNLAASAAAPE